MKLGWRRQLALLCVAAGAAIAILVPGGTAATRSAEVFFDAVPGPGAVTYGENIAYRATFTNTSGSNFTHVIFRMDVPKVTASNVEASFVDSTCPVNGGAGETVTLSNGTHEWRCDFGTVRAGTSGVPQLILSVVWQVPTLAQPGDCGNCLVTNGRFTAKEGTNDVSDPNDAFPPSGYTVAATLLAAESNTVNSTDTTRAGGYEIDPCADPLGAGSLRTKPTLDATGNPVSTTICLPSVPSNDVDLGLASTILEGPSQSGNPGHAVLGRSDVCVAALGENCGAFGTYPPHDFGTTTPLTLVFRITDATLGKGESITQVFHNGNPTPLPSCSTNPTNANGCVQSINLSNGKVKIWTIVVKSRTNGFYNW